jgi:hypothetical protein
MVAGHVEAPVLPGGRPLLGHTLRFLRDPWGSWPRRIAGFPWSVAETAGWWGRNLYCDEVQVLVNLVASQSRTCEPELRRHAQCMLWIAGGSDHWHRTVLTYRNR